MEQYKIDRINALARKAKQEGLSAEELEEREALRQEYRAAVRAHVSDQLERVYLVDKAGNQEKLKKKKS